MENRYINLIVEFEHYLQRGLTIEEIQFVKWLVAEGIREQKKKEFTLMSHGEVEDLYTMK